MPHRAGGPCDATGAWSSAVAGLRGRLVRTGERVELELDNVSARPLELHWAGYRLAFATFRLDDASGAEVPEPDWRYGGNEATGRQHLLLATGTTRVVVGDPIFGEVSGRRTVRIGAFWGREMPADGSPRFLRARVIGAQPSSGELDPATSAARGVVWLGSLDVPPVCLR